MSLAESQSGRPSGSGRGSPRALFSALGFAALLTFGGCGDGSTGFRPLYGTASIGGAATQEKLAAVDIAPIPGRVGQRIRNELIFQATGGGSPNPPQYRLDIAIRESVISTLVQVDGIVERVVNLSRHADLIDRHADREIAALVRFRSHVEESDSRCLGGPAPGPASRKISLGCAPR